MRNGIHSIGTVMHFRVIQITSTTRTTKNELKKPGIRTNDSNASIYIYK